MPGALGDASNIPTALRGTRIERVERNRKHLTAIKETPMDPKTSSKNKGIRMAMKVAALSLAAGGTLMAMTATEAAAADATNAADGAKVSDAPTIPMKSGGWSCWTGRISRGPLAPPCQTDDDFLALLNEVPS
jgi:hypothetical protein